MSEPLDSAEVRARKYPPGRYRIVYRQRDGTERVLYDPQPRQDALHASRAPNILYGGQAGGGKSHGLRWHGIGACLRVPGLKVLLLRRNFTDLEKSHLLELPSEVPEEVARYNAARHLLDFPNGSVMVFGHCKDEKALGAYLSSQWDIILIDEASLFTPKMLRMLRTRLRTKNRRIRPQFVCGTNPGGEGHLWLWQRFIAKDPPKEESRSYTPAAWDFIPSALEDNAYLDPEAYEEQFSELDEAEYKAYRGGDWEAFAGQFFRSWRRAAHVRPHGWTPPEWWEVAGGMDWAWAPGMGYVGWAAFDEHGQAVGYKELTFQEATPEEVADMIAVRCVTEMERRMLIHADTQMWTPKQDGSGVSIAEAINERLAAHGLEVTLVKANKDRLNGWTRFKQWLSPKRKKPDGTGGPWLTFVAGPTRGSEEEAPEDDAIVGGCPYLVQTIGAQLYDEMKPGDMKKGATDHGCDAWRYLLMAREPLAHVPLEARPRRSYDQRVAAHTARTIRRAAEHHALAVTSGDADSAAAGAAVYTGRTELEAQLARHGPADPDALDAGDGVASAWD